MFWIQNTTWSNRRWDKELNSILDKDPKITDYDGYCCKLGNYQIWIENYPFAYGDRYDDRCGKKKAYPLPLTRRRLKKYIEKGLQEEKVEYSQYYWHERGRVVK